ncbi:ANTAR domain-containing protein [Streptomyces sp. NPDC006654]|uniref:ANTAR domain-containing protein n=1 Tax=unclassified Streptomyces TaxID=2593676 RepID=UPI0033C0EDB3
MPEPPTSADRIAALEEEVAQLRHAMTAHAVVDQAMGVVVAYARVGADTAWEILREVSQHTNTKLREIAEHVVQWPRCGWLPQEVRGALDTAVLRRAAEAARPLRRPEHPGHPGRASR